MQTIQELRTAAEKILTDGKIIIKQINDLQLLPPEEIVRRVNAGYVTGMVMDLEKQIYDVLLEATLNHRYDEGGRHVLKAVECIIVTLQLASHAVATTVAEYKAREQAHDAIATIMAKSRKG